MTSLLTCDCPIDTTTFSTPLHSQRPRPSGHRTTTGYSVFLNFSIHYQVSLSREESLYDKYICACKVSIPAATPPVQSNTQPATTALIPPLPKSVSSCENKKTRGYTSGHLIYACYLPAPSPHPTSAPRRTMTCVYSPLPRPHSATPAPPGWSSHLPHPSTASRRGRPLRRS